MIVDSDDTGSDAVVVCFSLSEADFGTHDERERSTRVEDQNANAALGELGEVDGHEFGEGLAVIYAYGHDAEEMFDAMEPLLEAARPRRRR